MMNNDDQIFSIKPSKKRIYITAVKTLGLYIIACIILLSIKNALTNVFPNIPNVFGPIATIGMFLIIIYLVNEFVKVSTTIFTLTKTSLITQKGFFSIKRDNLDLTRIIDISSEEPLLYRLVKLGNITLNTIDKTDSIIKFIGIENYKEIEAQIKEYSTKRKPTIIETHNSSDIKVDGSAEASTLNLK